MGMTEYRIKEYDDTETDDGVINIIKQYMPQRRDNTFFDRLFGGGWSNLLHYSCNNIVEAKQVIENDKLKERVKNDRSIKYINVE